MSSSVDQLPQQPSDPDGSHGLDASEADAAVEAGLATSPGFDEAFADEVRSIFGVAGEAEPNGQGLFGIDRAGSEATDDAAATDDAVVADETVVADDAAPQLFATATVVAQPKSEDDKPTVGLFLPRAEEEPERAAPSLTGLSLAAGATTEAAAVPNLFVSSDVAPAEVAFVPAEEVERKRYLWLLILLGLLFVGGAIWLTILAQSSNTVDAPVTTIETAPSTTVSTTEAPATTASTTASTAAPTTEAPATTDTTVATTEAPVTTAAPQVQTTAPRRPATTARPRTTARPPTTAAPTTAAPTTAATVPDVTFAPPTWSPNTTAAAPPTQPVEPPAPPAEPVEPAAES